MKRKGPRELPRTSKAAAVQQQVPLQSAGTIQRFRTHKAESVTPDLPLDYHRVRKDSPYSFTYEDTKVDYQQELDEQENGGFTGTATEKFGEKQHPVILPGVPDLKISENDQLAIVNDEGQHREFFATQGALDTSNQKLDSALSAVRLVKEGGNIKLTEEGEALHRVVPFTQKITDELPEWEKLESLSTSYCNQVVDKLIGTGSRVAVLLGPQVGEEQREETEVPMKLRHNDPVWLRHLLSTPDDEKPVDRDLPGIYTNFYNEDEEKQEKAVSDYSELDKEERDRQALRFGLSENALPEPGEAYMTTSIGSPGYRKAMQQGVQKDVYVEVMQELDNLDPTLDIAEQQMTTLAKSLIDSWSYHFAAVVARDGADTVTLENYNRGVEHENIVRGIFHNLFNDFEEFRDHVRQKLEEGGEDENIRYGQGHYDELIRWMAEEIPKKNNELSVNARKALQEALDSLDKGLNVNGEYQNSLLYFNMYGPGDQSLHSAFKSSGYNPLTIRIRQSYKLDKEKYAGILGSADESLETLWSRTWKTDTCQKLVSDIFLSQVHAAVKNSHRVLDDVQSVSDMAEWKTTHLARLRKMIPVTGFELDPLISCLLELVPFREEFNPVNGNELLIKLRRVNEMCDANGLLTFESTLKKDFGDLDLLQYDLKKDIRKDLKQMQQFIMHVMQILARFNA